MTEYQALLVDNYDRDVREYFITETIRLNPGMTRDSAENLVSSRARSLLHQAAHVTTNTLAGLESLIRSANQLPGRKLVFFISGGFFLDSRNSDGPYKLQRITSAAARSGVVIYSMDARGLVASLQDASSESQFDPTGSLSRAAGGELLSSQNGMNALARDTGGKAIYNTNALETRLARVLKETSAYYLLAWKPEHQAQHAGRFRHIEVRVVGKPELTVHVRRGFFDVEPAEPQEAKSKKPPEQPPKEMTPAAQLRKVIGAPYPDRGIPISLSLNYMSVPNKGLMLAANLQIPNEFISLTAANGRQTGAVDVAGVFLNDRGQPGATFGNRLTIDAPSTQPANGGQDVAYGFPVYLGPGLYQVRVGARDEKSGRTGSAHAWIEIPDFSSGQLMLSSLLIGARAQPILTNASANTKIASDGVALSVDHHFSSNSYLRFLVFVYNAARAPSDSKPDVAIQLQVVRDQQPVITTPLKKISTDAIEDLNSLPYAAEISLSDLPTGRYLLRVTAVDRVTKRSASQQTRFDIEQ
jgi:hypothetical protein